MNTALNLTLRSIALSAILMASLVTGLGAAQANLSASPSWINFYDVEVGQWRTRTVRLTNVGTETMARPTVRVSCGLEFRVGETCFYDLDPNQSCELVIGFEPRYTGHFSCTISVSSLDGPSTYVNVTGAGVERRQ